MADVELVIKIPDHLYKLLKELPSDSNESNIENVLMKAVEHGTTLPKGHGRLIDADAFIDFLENISQTQKYNEFIIDRQLTGLTVDDVFKAVCESLQNEGLAYGDAPTIIEADKEERDDKE